MRFRIALVVFWAAVLLPAADPTQEYLTRAARSITDRAAGEVVSVQNWERLRSRRLEEMRDMLGLLPWPARTPLNVRITGTLDKGSYTVEKLAFESLPKVYVTANLYVPKQRKGRVPAIVYVCGHSYLPQGAKVQYQRHGISLAKNGYVAIILDPIQIAEVWGAHHGISAQNMYDWYSRGYTPAGIEVWNAMRAIDYLESRPEVDGDRIGMTGRSGGAAMSWFTAAVDPRVKAVMPVMGISTYAANVAENTQRLHCDCMFVINHWRQDMIHQGALIAPRPLLYGQGSKDNLFPVAGYKEFEDKVGGLYKSYGKPENFRLLEVPTAHSDSDFLREESIRFFDRFLSHNPDRTLDMSYTNAPATELAVYGDNAPADARNYLLPEFFVPRPEIARPALLETLRKNVFNGVVKAGVTVTQSGTADGLPELSITGPDGVPIRALVRRVSKAEKPLPGLVYIASDGDDARSIQELIREVAMKNSAVVLAVFPRGTGVWSHTTWKAMLRNAMHVGETVDSMRLRDVLAAAEALRTQPNVDAGRITVMGKGVAGALGLYAALLDERLHQVILMDPPETHAQGPVFLNILRYTDLPQAASMLAPRKLVYYVRKPAAWPAGFVTMSLAGPLEGRYNHGFASGM
ncbi:MAG TPA: acetylxylan esterase [Bryobacteraceae bacterium]|nr:acetylxylan esterase [Bryobacteraceae bacterium]